MPFNLTPVSSALADEIKITLGGSTDDDGIDVELTPSQLQQVITDSVRTLNAKRPRRAWAALTGYAEATSRYVLDHPGIIGVTNVALTSGNAACDDASCVFNVMPFYPSGPYSDQVGDGMTGPLYGGNVPALTQPGPGDTLADRMIALSYMDYSKLLGGQGPGWTVRNEAGVVVLYVAAGKQGKVMYEYSYRVTPDDDPTTGVGTVTRDSDRQWLKDYAVARAKMILGRVLRKHGGINMPGGSTEPMDGDALVTEGTQELQQLEDAIDKRRRPSLPLAVDTVSMMKLPPPLKPPHVPNFRAFAASLRRAGQKHSFSIVAEFADQEAEDFKTALLAQDFQSFKDVPLSPAYAELKRRTGLDARTMIATKRYVSHITVIERRVPGEPGKATIYVGFDKADKVLDRHGQPTNFPLYRLAEVQEEGTDNIPARPHWRPWLEQMRERAKDVRKEIVKAAVTEARRSL